MYRRFDSALAIALAHDHSLYGVTERSRAVAAARRAAAENREKALKESGLGLPGFATLMETASTRYHEDAEAMTHGRPPLNHPVSYYLKISDSYRRADARRLPPSPDTTPARRCAG